MPQKVRYEGDGRTYVDGSLNLPSDLLHRSDALRNDERKINTLLLLSKKQHIKRARGIESVG